MTTEIVARLRAVADHVEKHKLDNISQVGVRFSVTVNLYTPRGERLVALLSWVRTLGDNVKIKALFHVDAYHLMATGQLDDGTPVEVTAIAHEAERHQIGDELGYRLDGQITPQSLAKLVDEQRAPSDSDGVR